MFQLSLRSINNSLTHKGELKAPDPTLQLNKALKVPCVKAGAQRKRKCSKYSLLKKSLATVLPQLLSSSPVKGTKRLEEHVSNKTIPQQHCHSQFDSRVLDMKDC